MKDFDLYANIIKKPDFQRETNHWSPQQVASLLESYTTGDLIPSVILWKGSFIFVIDGGHRLSALRAWVLDDYGDGDLSQKFFNYNISKEQLSAAKKTRDLVNSKIGAWHEIKEKISGKKGKVSPEENRKISKILTQALTIQWVNGDADKAEGSFFNINMKGTPLDEVEEFLLKNRHKPTAIAARAVIRAGYGHKYWSKFDTLVAKAIEEEAKRLNSIIFDPDVKAPIKTLELPLGGSRGVRVAIQLLIDFITSATYGFDNKVVIQDDNDGKETLKCLKKASNLANRITGNDKGSLGLHPAVYFYGPSGRHSSPMFLGTAFLISKNIQNNNKAFFKNFTSIRGVLENTLIKRKEIIALIIQKHMSKKRAHAYMDILEKIISDLISGKKVITESDIITYGGLIGGVFKGEKSTSGVEFSDDTKSQVFISSALKSGVKCSICGGYIDGAKSVSYDHIKRVREGGKGNAKNCTLTHPYCNQSIKN